MYLQEILEVAIGLIFMWLVLSIAAMTMQEWVGNLFNMRARDLEKAIRTMLFSNSLAKQIYSHPLIASLYNSSRNPKRKVRLPSYLPPAKFAAALFDIVTEEGKEASPLDKISEKVDAALASSIEDTNQLKLALDDWQAILETGRHIAASGLGEPAVDTLKVQVQAFGKKYPEVQEALDENMPHAYAFYEDFFEEERNSTPAGTEVDSSMRQFRLGLKMLGETNARLRNTLTVLLRSAQTKNAEGEEAVARAQSQIEKWFNDAMDRLSGEYKRKAQFLAFAIGLFFAVLLNVDSVNLATTLWREPTLRQAIIAQVNNYTAPGPNVVASGDATGAATTATNPPMNIAELESALSVLNIPLGWHTASPVKYDASIPCTLNAASAYDTAGNPTRLLGVHLGSVCVPLVDTIPFNGDNWSGWLSKVIGLLLSGLAAAQGAPFWFDILNKVINVRSGGNKPASTATPVG